MNNDKFYIGSQVHQLLKFCHIILAAIMWGGIFSVMILTNLKHKNVLSGELFPIDYVIYKIFDYTIIYPYFGLLVTAMLYGAVTKWGFLKHYWIILKWILILVMFAVVWFWIIPVINGQVALSDAGFPYPGDFDAYTTLSKNALLYLPIFALLIAVIFLISVHKPWGIRSKQSLINQKTKIILTGIILILSAGFGLLSRSSLESYRSIKISDSNLETISDGKYGGNVTMADFTYEVEITITDHSIRDIRILKNRHSDYARFAEGVIPRIIDRQNANVRAITGATTTSKALMKAVENAFTGNIPE